MRDWQHLTLSTRVYLKYLLQKLFLRGPRLHPSGHSVVSEALGPGTRGATGKAATPSRTAR